VESGLQFCNAQNGRRNQLIVRNDRQRDEFKKWNDMSASNDIWNETMLRGSRVLTTPCRGATEEKLEHFKQQLLSPLLASVQSPALEGELRAVANEAAALAWYTVCPVLVLPALLEEKTRVALKQWERQQRLLATTAPTTTPLPPPRANAA
jgi:hypothetical protein